MQDLLCVQLASYLEGGPLMWMMPLTCTLIRNLIMIDDEIIKNSFLINYQKKYALLPTCISKQNGQGISLFLFRMRVSSACFLKTLTLSKVPPLYTVILQCRDIAVFQTAFLFYWGLWGKIGWKNANHLCFIVALAGYV